MSGLFDNMRRELQVEAGSGLHPEAEVLNAYLEGVLAPQERESVVTHLARCASCREVVALAAPPLTQTPPPKSLKDPAVRLALWRWAVVATTAVVVIAAVVVNNDRRGSEVARVPAMVTTPAPSAESAPPAANAKSEPIAAAKAPSSTDELRDAKKAPATREADKDAALQKVAPKEEAKKQVTLNAAAKPATPAPSAANEVAVAQPEAAPLQGQAVAGGAPMRRDMPAERQGYEARSAPAPAPPAPAFAEMSNANAGMTKMKSARAATAVLDAAVAAPRWTITREGALEKSLDGGGSWQAVSVSPGVRFRAIAAIGADIWAGGAKAMLFHSQDGGQTWTRVQPGGLSGDIVRLEFTDPQRGQLATSAGEKCSTQDGGRSWLCR